MIKTWWETLAPRERWFMSVGGILLSLILICLYIWMPFINAVNSARADVEHKRELIQWMQAAVTKIDELKARGLVERTPSSGSLLVIVNQSAQHNHLSPFISQIREINTHEVSLEFTSVPFDKLVTWLESLWREYGIEVTMLNLTPEKTAGLVQVSLNLKK